MSRRVYPAFQSWPIAHILTTACVAVISVGFATETMAQSASRGQMTQPAVRQYQPPAGQPIQGRVIQNQAMPTQGSTTRAPAGSTTKATGSMTKAPGSTTKAAGSGTRSTAAAVGIDGYCPVCIIEMKKWMKGNPAFSAAYDGKTYYFPGEDQRQMFLADPAKYAPALGGDCTVCLKEMSKRMPGSVHFTAISKNRLYLFPSDKQKQMFVANPDKYLSVDVAMDGMCAVCKVEMGQDMQGSPDVWTLHNGMKYHFPSDKQRQMFLANPAKYTMQENAPPIR